MNTYNYQYPGLDKSTSLSSKVEINISCSNLPKLDVLSKSDPKVFIFIEKKGYNDNNVDTVWEKFDATETIKNNSNPVFTKSFFIDYYFETIVKLRFIVFDMNSESDEWSKNDFIGYTEKSLGDLITCSKNNVYECELLTSVPSGMEIKNSKVEKFSGTSKMHIRIEEVTDSPCRLKFSISGSNLDKKDTFGKSDPFIVISLLEDNGSTFKVFETPVIKNTLNPTWENFEVVEKSFNKGDPDKMLFFEVYDWDKDSSNDLIGSFMATTKKLFEQKTFEIINESKKKKMGSKYKNSGVITFNKIERIRDAPFSFMDFPMNGTEINVTFAIDFTSSNGLKNSPSSLHYNRPDYDINNFFSLNEYEKAISSIGFVLEPYDSNKYMDVFGYGGIFFNRSTVEFDCALTGNNNPSVLGVSGILTAYHNALQTVKLYGPTNFAPIIKKITDEARKNLPPPNKNNPLPKYHILTIITDGCISDMERTKEMIIDAEDAPLSIIIIGVGKENFARMKELDGDDNNLKCKNKTSKRDIVQFLPLSQYISNPELLAAETLKEIPKQVVEFTERNKYKPMFYY